MHTERYCKTLDNLDRVKAIRAIHEAHLQLCAAKSGRVENLDHTPALESLWECLSDAGHAGTESESVA